MKRAYSVYYLTIFILSLCHQLSHAYDPNTNYTFTAMGDYTKRIPAVCWLTLHCPGARNHNYSTHCIDMDGNENECTLNVSGLALNESKTFCSGSSTVTVDPGITVAIEEENSDMNIISKGATLMCTPIGSCNNNMNVSIVWYESLLNGTNNNEINETSSQLNVEARQYGIYTCNVTTTGNEMASITYALYGGPRFSNRNEHIRATLNDRVEFTCDPTSHPSITNNNTMWLRDGYEPSVLNYQISEDRKTIIFEEVDYDDEAVYTCQVSNAYNSNSKSFQLKVRSPLTPLWPAIGIIIELSLVAIIIGAHEWYKKHQQKKVNNQAYNPTFDELKKKDEEDDTEAYNFPAHSINYSQHERQRIGSITKENLLPDSVQ